MTAAHEASTTAPRGYTLVLPPGWARIPARGGADGAVDGILDRALAGLPRDRVAAVRRDLRGRILDLLARGRECAALDVYLPVRKAADVALTCSFVVSEVSEPVPVPDGVEQAVLLARILARDRSRAVELPAALAARSERAVAGDDGTHPAARRVDYVLPVPRDAGRWVAVSFSTLGAGDPNDDFAALQVELFDAVMTTFRWRVS